MIIQLQVLFYIFFKKDEVKCELFCSTTSITVLFLNSPCILNVIPTWTQLKAAQMNQVILRNNVKVSGQKNAPTIMLAHGFGCDQNMWRFMLPELEKNHQVVLFDYVGSGNSLLKGYSKQRYSTLEGYAEDIKDIINELQLKELTIIGHSVSSIIASIVSIDMPNILSNLIMVCPSPCFLNIPPDYQGGFERSDLEELIGLMDKNYIGWANYLAPLVMGSSQSQELIGELSGSFCSTDPIVAKIFAKATFFSDHRHILQNITCPTLILQSADDSLASVEIGEYMAENITNSELAIVNAQGHCLHMTNPLEIIPIVLRFLE